MKWITALLLCFLALPVFAHGSRMEHAREMGCPQTIPAADANMPNLSDTSRWERKKVIDRAQATYSAYFDKTRPHIAVAAILVLRKEDTAYRYHIVYQVGQQLRMAYLDTNMHIRGLVCVKPTLQGTDKKTYDLAGLMKALQEGLLQHHRQ